MVLKDLQGSLWVSTVLMVSVEPTRVMQRVRAQGVAEAAKEVILRPAGTSFSLVLALSEVEGADSSDPQAA